MQPSTHHASSRPPLAPRSMALLREPRSAFSFSLSPQATHDADFLRLLDAFRSSGGMARADDLATQLRFSSALQHGVLARRIVERAILSVRWNEIFWLPVFQFQRPDLTPYPQMAAIMAELPHSLDDWQKAEWFAQPNGWLNGSAPAAVIPLNANAVLQAARADRFAIEG